MEYNAKNLICSMFRVPCSMKQKGVTLVELTVVLAVISIIVSVTIGIFTSFIRQQGRILAEQELLNQTNYALEYIARSVRDGVKDDSGSCLGGSFSGYYYVLSHFDSVSGSYQGIKVLSKDNVCHEFFLDVDAVLKEIKDGQASQPIASNKFAIEYIRFVINGDESISSASSASSLQPRTTISMGVQFEVNGEQQSKVIQTTISQDALNVADL